MFIKCGLWRAAWSTNLFGALELACFPQKILLQTRAIKPQAELTRNSSSWGSARKRTSATTRVVVARSCLVVMPVAVKNHLEHEIPEQNAK